MSHCSKVIHACIVCNNADAPGILCIMQKYYYKLNNGTFNTVMHLLKIHVEFSKLVVIEPRK